MRTHRPVFASAFAVLALSSAACSDTATVTQPGTAVAARRVYATASVALSPADTSVAAGSSLQIASTAADRRGNAVSADKLTWSSSDTLIATVDGRGLVAARAAGVATITASYTSAVATSKVTVLAPGTTTPPPSTTTTTPPPTTDTTTTTVSSGGSTAISGPYVTVNAGQSIQAAVDANAGGTQFLIKAGTYSQQTVSPKSGDVFVGEAGAVLDGGNVTTVAFDGSNGASSVTIRGLKITRYASALTGGTIAGDNGTNWVVSDNEISFGGGVGVRMGVGMQLLRNNIHDNRHTGIDGTKSSHALVEQNTVVNNATAHSDVDGVYGDAAGMKIFRTDGVVVRNNVVRDNWGPGIWFDTDNINSVIEGNTVTGNTHRGIMFEISYGGVIRNNDIENNGFGVSASWISNAGVFVVSSPDVQVYGNTIKGNRQGIVGVQTGVGSGAYGAYVLQNLSVHDNIVTQAQGISGIDESVNSDAVFTRNNVWSHNTYYLSGNAQPFLWHYSNLSASGWKSVPQDATGSFQ